MPTELLTRNEHRASPQLPAPRSTDGRELNEQERVHRRRVRRLRLNVLAFAVGTMLITTLWVVHEWQANGWFSGFGHEGANGDWNPTLWAIPIGLWGMVVGITALRVYFVRPGHDRIDWLKFHASAWFLGMIVLTGLWALIEWQDNGGFERFSNNSTPGDWDPWIFIVSAIWAAFVVAIYAARLFGDRSRT